MLKKYCLKVLKGPSLETCFYSTGKYPVWYFANSSNHQYPLLLAGINFNPCMDM